ncbi:hypothetical protein RT717_13365 [Imperialibacter roseus]|uniref:Uncharacterized protein n=1 Tax=Imperialibacter roseus TaxID=1324217 RepID=A0ABZ0IZR3_9BACT|nr:hypothetical protein [Imperialibacter roseus]WOK09629.1 hypothetical protein RT717_13365 [Imperialibacter roseus]
MISRLGIVLRNERALKLRDFSLVPHFEVTVGWESVASIDGCLLACLPDLWREGQSHCWSPKYGFLSVGRRLVKARPLKTSMV